MKSRNGHKYKNRVKGGKYNAFTAGLSRRSFLVSGAAAITAMQGLPATPSCVLAGEQEQGPYYLPAAKFRSDITEGKPGVPLRLRVQLVNSKTCTPLPNAAFDIWHCDATGIYSGFTSMSPDGGPGDGVRGGGGTPPDFGGRGFGGRGPGGRGSGGPPPDFAGSGRGGERQIDATRFLRGLQLTNDQGVIEFNTLYPGWYAGRAIHIHMKVHLAGQAEEIYQGGHVSHTGQFFLPEEITERVAKLEPYSTRLGVHRTTQAEDSVFNDQHGAASMLRLERINRTSEAEGFIATAMLAVDPDASPAPVGMGGPGGRGGRGRGPGRA